MSAVLLDQVLAYVRSQFTKAEAATVQAYGGEFGGAEVPKISFHCPAIFVTVLGSISGRDGVRQAGKHARKVRLAAFVCFKHAERTQRMRGALVLAEKLAMVLREWSPMQGFDGVPVLNIAALEEEATTENLYGPVIDKQGMALWLVGWEQAVKPARPVPQLYDLLAVEITDLVQPGVVPAPADTNTGPAGVVTHEINFQPTGA